MYASQKGRHTKSTDVEVCLVFDRQQEVFLNCGTKIQREEGGDSQRAHVTGCVNVTKINSIQFLHGKNHFHFSTWACFRRDEYVDKVT